MGNDSASDVLGFQQELRRLLVGIHTAAAAGPDPRDAGARYLAVVLTGLHAPLARA